MKESIFKKNEKKSFAFVEDQNVQNNVNESNSTQNNSYSVNDSSSNNDGPSFFI